VERVPEHVEPDGKLKARRIDVDDAAPYRKFTGFADRARPVVAVRREIGRQLVEIDPVADARRPCGSANRLARRHALQYRVDRREQEERLARALLSEPGEARKRRHPPRADIRVRRHTVVRSEEHTSELQSRENLVCRLLLEKKKKITKKRYTIA